MTTVSKSFTDVDTQSDVLALKAIGENITVSISGTYAMTLELQREVGSPSSGAWERVLGPWSTANATVTAYYVTTRQNERLRLACTADTSGTGVTTIADGDLGLRVLVDNEGNVLQTRSQAGVVEKGTLTVDGASTLTGAVTVSGTLTAATIANTNIDAGASGTAGTVDIFPTTAAKGKVQFTATDSTGDTTTTITNAAQAGAVTYTIPDAGASASFVMTAGAQTIAGAKSFTGRITTTDGVASGTAKVVGGRAYAGISSTDALLASAGASAHVDFASTYSIPANTIGSGTVIRISGSVLADQVDGTDTLEIKVYLGGTTLLTTTAFDPSAVTDFVNFDFELVSRAAASAASAIVGKGEWVTSDTGAETRGAAVLASTNFATNGALVVKVSAKWSSTTALTNARLHTLNVDIL